MWMRLTSLALAFVVAAPLLAQAHQPVLMISIDGLRPDYITQADQHHLRIPTLRRICHARSREDGPRGRNLLTP
jgi:predicted AlkP superfamily pyrophosphatase or phosphodiesterase